MAERSAVPFGVDGYDNPETIRFKKYATGLQLILQGGGIETGQSFGPFCRLAHGARPRARC